MPDDPITRLNAALEGRYRIERQLGEGGMATVYLARDEKHNRNVALKVLKPELAAVVGADRFLAEIQTTANLQHPHILPLFDSGEAGGFLFYVMPYVEGESLRERLDREHQLPVDEAVQIARNVAEALDYAHSHGVIHRDIKPANILLQAGKPVVSDFGIALAVGVAGAGRLTETGLSLGTPHYMSPEQATGDQSVGVATDIYALGCVLYEMLVGEPPYTGGTPQAVLGKIIAGELASPTKQRTSVPRNVDAAIRRALEKVPADRFTGAQDFAKALADPGFRYGAGGIGADASRTNRWKAATVATSALALLAFALAFWPAGSVELGSTAGPVARFESFFRADQAPVFSDISAFAMAPDGSMLVYTGPSATSAAGWRLWMRRWDDPSAVPLPDTDFGWYSTVSSDGRQVVFVRSAELFLLSLDGGPVRRIAQGQYPRWGPNDEYVYFRAAGGAAWRVRALGGEPEQVRALGEAEVSNFVSDFLPGGQDALLRVGLQDGGSEIRLLTLETGETKTLAAGGWPTYVAPGYILFLTEVNALGTLMAVPFDLESMDVTGPPQALIENVRYYSISDAGDLVYTTSTGGEGDVTELVWVDRAGRAEPVDPGWRFDNISSFFFGWRLSPDNQQIAYTANSGGSFDIWIKDLPAGLGRQLTFEGVEEFLPWWSPDGRQVAYLRGPTTAREVWVRNVDGTGQPTRLMGGSPPIGQGVWSEDGTWLVLRTYSNTGPGPRDIVAFRPGTDTAAVPILTSPDYGEEHPALSPDGRWLAYTSERVDPNGQVFVSPFPNVEDGRWPVSQGSGYAPAWAHSGRELFFLDSDNRMTSATVETEPTFRVTDLEPLFEIPSDFQVEFFANFYDVSRDDQRFLMGRAYGAQAGQGPDRFILVQNFFEELNRLVPTN